VPREGTDFGTSGNRFAFTSHYYDTETGLYYAKARYYSPATGRFIQADSYLGKLDDVPSLHRYTWAHNRPTFFVDPDGHRARVVEDDPQRTGFRVSPEGYTEALTYSTEVTVTDDAPSPGFIEYGKREYGSSGVRTNADEPRRHYTNAVARQHAENGQLNLAEIAEANHGCAYCHIVKERRSLMEADEAVDLEHYNRMSAGFGAAATGLEAGVSYGGFQAFSRTPVLRSKPVEPYNRQKHYGRTPTQSDRKAMGAGASEVVDHDPPLVQRYYEGDPAYGEKPGYMQTPSERKASGTDRSRMKLQPKTDSNKQGADAKKYSDEKKKEFFDEKQRPR
jgi:RHS repeat-associated protein